MTRTGTINPPITERFIRVLQAEGLAGIASRIIYRWKKAFGWKYFFVFSYPIHPNLPVPPVKADIQFQTLDPMDQATFQDMLRMYGSHTPAGELLSRLERGEICYLGKIDGQVIGYFWMRIGGVVPDGGHILYALKAGDAYAHDAYVVPDQRGKNIIPALKATAARNLARNYGIQQVITLIEWFNHASLRTTRKLGEPEIGRILLIKIFGRKLSFWITRRAS